MKKQGLTWPVAEAQRGTGGSFQATASPGSQTGKQQSVEVRGCPVQLVWAVHRGSLGQNALQQLKQMENYIFVVTFSFSFWDLKLCFPFFDMSIPLWRCWLGSAVVRLRKDCWISCRVLNRGDMLTSLDRSWSLKQGAGLCRWTKEDRIISLE